MEPLLPARDANGRQRERPRLAKQATVRTRRCPLLLLVAFALGFGTWLVVAALDSHLPSQGSPPTILANQCRHDFQRLVRAAIGDAKSSIFLATYTLRDPKILQALKLAAERGVQVTIFIDAAQASGLPTQLGQQVTLVKRKSKGLMHQKLLVIDERRVLLGSTNLTVESLRSYGNHILVMDSPAFAVALIETMAGQGVLSVHRFEASGQEIEYWQLPEDGKEALHRLIGLIDTAQSHIRIAMFTWTHPDLTDAVMRAHRRGVLVEVAIDRSSGRGASQKTVEALLDAGIRTSLNVGPELLHHKLAWIDDTLITGSANWTRSAFRKNNDSLLILEQLSTSQTKTLTKLWRVLYLESKDPGHRRL